jgi:hypothetical protein
MEEQESPAGSEHGRKRSGSSPSFFERIAKKIFLTPEEKWARKKRKHKRRNPLRDYIRRTKERWAYQRYQKRELNRKKKHRKAAEKTERTPWFQNSALQKFLKQFSRESRPYYYYSETDQPKSEIQKQRKRLIHFMINSTVLFLITYILAYVTYQAVVMFTASRFGINSVLYFYEVAFPIGNNSSLWDINSGFNIILITFAGPFISVILGVFYLLLYVRKEKTKGLGKLFVLWLSYHSLNFFLGAFVGGVITQQGFGYVIEWLFMATFLKFGLSIVFIFSMGLVGYLHTIYFLESSNSLYWTQKHKKNWLVLFGGIIPWAISSIILFIIKYPVVIPMHTNITVYDSVMYGTIVAFIAPMLVNFKAKPNFDQTVRKARGRRISWLYLIILILILVVFRVGLNDGFSYFVFK